MKEELLTPSETKTQPTSTRISTIAFAARFYPIGMIDVPHG